MKLPQRPPDWQPLWEEAMRQGAGPAFFQIGREESQRRDRYLHWDEFRHRVAASGGWSKEQQWAAVRMTRAAGSHLLPLQDGQGRPFTFFLTQRAFELLHEIDLHCGGGIGVAEEGIIQEDTRDRYYIDSLIEEALTSSQLEGAVVTRSEARDMIRRQRPPATEHERMVMNNFRTMRLLSELKLAPLSPAMILRIHREVTAGTLRNPEHEGRWRGQEDEVRVEDDESGEVVHTPPAAASLEWRMNQLCEFANEEGMNGFLHPVIRAVVLHFWIAYDHPFVDGNGRTARALFYWSMLRHGYWLAEFFSISQEILKAPRHYYRAFLHTETDGNDLNYFLLHQLGVISASIASLRDHIRTKQAESEAMRRTLGPGTGYNHRQLALLRHALKHPFAAYTVVGHQTSHNISNQTAKNDLAALETNGLLLRSKVGKAFVFSPIPDLSGKLKL